MRPNTLADVAFQAAKSGDLSLFLNLLGQGQNPDERDRHGFTALARAAQYDRLDMVHALLDAGAEVNVSCKWGMTPLMGAKSGVVAEALLAAGADTRAVTLPNRSGMEPGQTALMKAGQGGHLAVVQALLSHGADLEVRDPEGRSALIFAAANGHEEVTQALVKAGATIGLVEATLLGDAPRVKALLEIGQASEITASALWWAAWVGRTEIVHLLLNGGADIDARGLKGRSVLMSAALAGSVETVKFLILSGADVNTVDAHGATALHNSLVSLSNCKHEIVRALLEAGADVNQRTGTSWPTYTGGTALMEAALHGATDCAQALIEYGADLEAVCDYDEDGIGGVTALLCAVANNRLDTISLLVESGADINNKGYGMESPLAMARKWARRTGNNVIAEFLVNRGAKET